MMMMMMVKTGDSRITPRPNHRTKVLKTTEVLKYIWKDQREPGKAPSTLDIVNVSPKFSRSVLLCRNVTEHRDSYFPRNIGSRGNGLLPEHIV